MRESYQRHLPHQIPAGFPIFLTWNLKGALPSEVIKQLHCERQRLEREPLREGESAAERKRRHSKVLFAIEDRFLDRITDGPLDLRHPLAAKAVVDSLLFGVPERYDLFAFVVMGNHVHILLMPRWELSRITQGIKGFTAHRINDLQKCHGRTFWQDESYDHWVRDDEEMIRIIAYIENNPVKAGLCHRPEDWPWSSACCRTAWPIGQPMPPGTIP